MVREYINGVLQSHAWQPKPETPKEVAELPKEPVEDLEKDEKAELRQKLTEAGIEFDGRAGIAKLRELAGAIEA